MVNNMKYKIVYKTDFVDFSEKVYDSSEDAYFWLAYMDESENLTVMVFDDDGNVYAQEGQEWVKIG